MRPPRSASGTFQGRRTRAGSPHGPGSCGAKQPACSGGAGRTRLHSRASRVPGTLMLLAVDVGNTNVTLALFDGERLAAGWGGTPPPRRTARERAGGLRQLFELRGFELSIVDGVVISSVVPNINPALVEASRRYLKC